MEMLGNRTVEGFTFNVGAARIPIVAQRRDVSGMNLRPIAKDNSPLNQIFKLANIPGPGIGHELSQSILAQLHRRQIILSRKLIEKMLRQQANVL